MHAGRGTELLCGFLATAGQPAFELRLPDSSYRR
jgi:hypothetical protein